MNEELKIIITAVTDTAQKSIKSVNGELKNLGKQGKSSGASFGSSMKAAGKTAMVAAGVAVAAITAITGALTALGNASKEYRQEQAKLNTAFLAAGSTTEQAAKSYNDLYRFLGDSAKATEAAAHLAKLTTDEKELAEWTTTLQGVYATFGDSLPIEGLTEAANETARVGTVTGTLADALNWAGVNEDAFNASLAACNTTAEREALIRGTLNSLYSDAALIYERNNADIIAQNEAQARLDATTGQLGKTIVPLLTALINLSNVILTALGPAIAWISNALATFINLISKAVSWVMSFIGVLGGSKKAAENTQSIAAGVAGVASGAGKAASGVGALSNNLGAATKAAEKLKRQTAGFDELNVLSSGTSSSSGSTPGAGVGGSGGGIGGGGGGLGLGGVAIDTGGLNESLDQTSTKMTEFVNKLKGKIGELKNIFAPTIEAWKGAFATLTESWNMALPNFTLGAQGIVNGFMNVATYLLETFIPNIVNSFSENLAPIYGDVWGLWLEEAGKDFALFGELVDDISADIIKPALESVETIVTDVFDAIGDAWDKYGAGIIKKLTTFFDGIREDIREFYDDVIKPIWDKLKSVVDKVWKESLEPLVRDIIDAALDIGSNLLDLYNKTIKPIVDWIQRTIYPIIVKVVSGIIDRVGLVVSGLAKSASGITKTLKGIIQFITGIFTGDWKKAWEGVKNIFKGIFDSLVNIVKIPLNLIISGLNTMLRGFSTAINAVIRGVNKMSFTVPDWVPKIGGQQFGFNLKEVSTPQIPKLARGGIVTAATQIIAGERGREAILPLESNTEWMDKLAEKIAEKNNNPSKIVLVLDDTELGWANIRSINGITKQTGKIQLAMA